MILFFVHPMEKFKQEIKVNKIYGIMIHKCISYREKIIGQCCNFEIIELDQNNSKISLFSENARQLNRALFLMSDDFESNAFAQINSLNYWRLAKLSKK